MEICRRGRSGPAELWLGLLCRNCTTPVCIRAIPWGIETAVINWRSLIPASPSKDQIFEAIVPTTCTTSRNSRAHSGHPSEAQNVTRTSTNLTLGRKLLQLPYLLCLNPGTDLTHNLHKRPELLYA